MLTGMSIARSERTIVFCVGAVQFVNILDFVMVMPLGPDFARALDIPLSHLGYVGGSYTAAAFVSGLAGAFFLDRFDRRKSLAVAMAGLVVGTLAGAFAVGLGSLMAARIVAGAFGGPATSISYSIIADVVPAERRGKALGAVMAAFAIASILGVPAGLELARLGGWRAPFAAVALLGAMLGTFAYAVLPPMRAHLARPRSATPLREMAELLRFDVALSLFMTFVVMAAGFILLPSISAYVLGNLHYPREHLGLLYLAGGSVSLVSTRLAGVLVDRFGSTRIGTASTLFVAGVIYLGFVRSPPAIPVMAIFIFFMLGMSMRNVAYNTLTSKVPRKDERARFGSLQSAVQHLASALAAFAASLILRDLPDETLVGIPTVSVISIALGLLLPGLLWAVETRVLRTAAAAPR
jgi:predicted MFS family arabinose efflux permease